MLDDLLVKINVDMSPLTAAAPKVDANLNAMRTSINRINTTPIRINAEHGIDALETISHSAIMADATLRVAAQATGVLATSLRYGSVAANVFGQSFAAIDKAVVVAMTPIGAFAAVASSVAPAMTWMSNVLTIAAGTLHRLASGARVVGNTLGTVVVRVRAVSDSVLHFIHSLHAAQIVGGLMTSALGVVIGTVKMFAVSVVLSVKAVMSLAAAIGGALGGAVKWLWSGFTLLTNSVFRVAVAFASMTLSVLKVWWSFKGFVSSIRIVFQWLGMLPPKLRILVGGLLLLGAAGKAGALVMRGLAAAASAVAFVVKGASIAVRALALPVQAIFHPLRALRNAALLAAEAVMFLGSAAIKAAVKLVSLGSSVASAVGNVASMIGGKLLSVIKSGITGFALLGGAAAAWGIKMAVKAEQSTVVFGTMLKDMKAGKALMNELENWSGAPLFDPEEIQLSGTLLFKAGVAADKITGKLDQLGNIAAATKTPLDDLAKIYQQGMNQGAFQQDKINQLSDRGIAIYEGLAHATGVSGQALKEMIRDGKIGPAEMNAAIEHLTTGTGIYAGAMTNLSQTTGGMWSGMMQKAGMAAREFGINIMTAIDAKGLMTQATTFFSNLKSQISNALPAFSAIATVVRAAFSAVWEIATVTFSAITGALGLTSDNWMVTFLEWSAIATWAFQQWPDIATLAFVNVGLALVRFGADWRASFYDAGQIVLTVFANIGKNIKMAMKEIWDYISSGGRNKMRFAFTPLMDGFKASIREIGPIEADLAAMSERLGDSLGGSLAASIDANMQMLDKFKADQAAYVAPTLDGAHGPGDTTTATDTAAAGDKKRTSFAVDSLDRGSEAALKAIFASSQQDKAAQQQVNEQKTTNKLLGQLVAKSDGPKIAVQGAV